MPDKSHANKMNEESVDLDRVVLGDALEVVIRYLLKTEKDKERFPHLRFNLILAAILIEEIAAIPHVAPIGGRCTAGGFRMGFPGITKDLYTLNRLWKDGSPHPTLNNV